MAYLVLTRHIGGDGFVVDVPGYGRLHIVIYSDPAGNRSKVRVEIDAPRSFIVLRDELVTRCENGE